MDRRCSRLMLLAAACRRWRVLVRRARRPPTRPRRERRRPRHARDAGARRRRERGRRRRATAAASAGRAAPQPAGQHSGARVSRDRRRQEHALHPHRRELQGRSRGRVQARLPADHDRADARQGFPRACRPGCRRSCSCSTTPPTRSSATSSANGKLEIDPTSAVGIWLDFAKTHPGWKNRAVFCMLNGGAAGHNFFGDKPQVRRPEEGVAAPEGEMARRPGLRAVLAHAVAREAEQVSGRRGPGADRPQRDGDRLRGGGLQGAHDGAAVRDLAEEPAARVAGQLDRSRRPSKTHSYKFDAVLEVAGGPARSPYDPQFNPKSINRIEAIGNDISRHLNKLDKDGTRFVPPGEVADWWLRWFAGSVETASAKRTASRGRFH